MSIENDPTIEGLYSEQTAFPLTESPSEPVRFRSSFRSSLKKATRILTALFTIAPIAFAFKGVNRVIAAEEINNPAAERAADWLLGEQLDSGLWPTTPGNTTPSTFNNGIVGRAMLEAYRETNDTAYLDAAEEAGYGLISDYPVLFTDGDPNIHKYHDPLFMEELSQETGDLSYAAFIQQYLWDKLNGGTYGESNDLDASELCNSIVDEQQGFYRVEYAPWYLAGTAIAAKKAEQSTTQEAYMECIEDALEKITDVTVFERGLKKGLEAHKLAASVIFEETPMEINVDSDFRVYGFGASTWASRETGIELDPEAGVYSYTESTADLAKVLSTMTLDQSVAPYWDGAFLWSSTADPTDLTNADAKATSFALFGLEGVGGYIGPIGHGQEFLEDLQDPATGQVVRYFGDPLNSPWSIEITAEALSAFGIDWFTIYLPLVTK